MSDRKLAVLGMLAVIMAGWAILQSRLSQRVNEADFSSSALIEGMDIEAMEAIQITSEQGQSVTTLQRSGKGFVVTDKDVYPADIAKINTLINNCLDIRTYEVITSNPDNHADLKVTTDTARYVVEFQGDKGNTVVGFAMSETDEDQNAFVRLLSSDQVYSVQSPPFINTQPLDFVDKKLLQVEKDKIASVSVQTEEDEYMLTSPEGSDNIEMENMPAGKQFKGTAYESVFGALGYLNFDDVMSVESAPKDLQFDSVYTCKLYDKTVYKLVLAKADEKTYTKISADFTDKTPVEKERRVESEEELKEKEAKLLAIDNVTEFNQKHQNWVYEIPSYKADNLVKPLSEIIEDIPEPEPTQDEQTSGDEATETEPMTAADPNAVS